MNRTIVLVLGVVFLGVGLGVSYTEWASGIQPWGQLLGDSFLFARSLPFTVGFGIAVGFWRATGWIPETYVKRFHAGWYARISSETNVPSATSASAGSKAASTIAGSAGGAA